MKNILTQDKFLFWLPRILSILTIGFLAIFALDVFVPGQTFTYYLVALVIHLLPNFLLVLLLFIAWNHEKGGGVLFILLAICFTVFFKTYESFINFMLVSFPVFLIGVLFLLQGNRHKERESKT